MTFSLVTIAKCCKCNCIVIWHFENAPFVDSEIIGTCHNCIQEVKHTCRDERDVPTITGIYPEEEDND